MKTYNRKYGNEYRKHETFCSQIINILKNEKEFSASAKKATELATQCRTHANYAAFASGWIVQLEPPDGLNTFGRLRAV